MNYRLIIRYEITGEVIEQPFEEAEYADNIIVHLCQAIENGAKLGFELQHRSEDGENEILEYGGNSIGEWTNLSWGPKMKMYYGHDGQKGAKNG